SQHRLYFEPGSAHRYSNGGYVLLGLVVERASGMDLADFMRKRIFQPLGMKHTLMYEHDRGPQVSDRAYGYSDINGKWTRTDRTPRAPLEGTAASTPPSTTWPSGMRRSTPTSC